MNRQLYIYVAGPYTAATEREVRANVDRAIDAGVAILSKGHYPFIPHLTHFVDLRCNEANTTLEYEEYLLWDLGWLKKCDAILHLGNSPGVEREMEAARRRSMQVFYSLDEIPDIDSDVGQNYAASAHESTMSRRRIKQLT